MKGRNALYLMVLLLCTMAACGAIGQERGSAVGAKPGEAVVTKRVQGYPVEAETGMVNLELQELGVREDGTPVEGRLISGDKAFLFTSGSNCVVMTQGGRTYIRELGKETPEFLNNSLRISKAGLDYLFSDPEAAYEHERAEINTIRTYPVEVVSDYGEEVYVDVDGQRQITLAPEEEVTRLFFKQSGDVPLIYSDNPESVRAADGNLLTEQNPGYYTIKEEVRANKRYTAEYYQNKEAGALYEVGFAVVNHGEQEAKLTVFKEGAQLDYFKDGKLTVEKLAHSIQMQLDYFNNDNPRELTVAPKGGVTIIKSVEVPGNYGFSTAKADFIADRDLELRIFYKYAQTPVSAIKDFPMTPILANPHQLTGTFHHNTLTANVYAPAGTRFRINSIGYINENEYIMPENATGKLPDAELLNVVGNYSLHYELNLLGAEGKKLQIIPNFVSSTSSDEASILICGEDGLWYATEILRKPENPLMEKPAWVIDVPEGGVLRFLIPGANSANLIMEVF